MSPRWSSVRKKTPTVLQMEAVECGAASLAMILAYYGRIVPIEELRVECGVSRDGSKASNVLRAARKYGLEARGFRQEPDELRDLPLPMILFWNFNHFVVLEGIKGGKAFINDPASGPKVFPLDEFDQSFTGVALTFEKTKDFIKKGKKPSVLSSLGKRLEGCSAAVIFTVLAGLFLVIPGLVIPTFSQIFVDNILVAKMSGWIQPLILAMVLTALLQGFLTWIQQYYLARFETRIAITQASAFFRHVFRLPVEFFSQRYAGEIGSRVQLNDKVAQLLSGQLATNLINLLLVFFYVILMLQYDIVLTLIGVSIALLNILVLKYVSGKRTILAQRLRQEQGKLMGVAMSGLQMIETLKSTGSESDFYAQWSGYQAKTINVQQQLAVPNQILSVMPITLLTINNLAILSIGAVRVMDGFLTMGMLVAFQSLMVGFINPFNQMVNLGGVLQQTQADMARLDDVYNYQQDDRFLRESEIEADSPAADIDQTKLSGRVELGGISFGYNRLEPPLIENFSLDLKPGDRVALVGGSGSGKSTIAKVMSGLYGAWQGEVLFDGQKIGGIPQYLLSNSLSMVDQEIFMFAGPVRDNIAMWDKTIAESEIVRAAKDAAIHDDIAARSGGYLSYCEEGGSNFSGGQRQRIEIARALVTNPSIMILDEATSALDPHTEKIINDNLRRRGCTCIIVAHRLSTIRDCDEIIVLKRGKVVERGNHEELMKLDRAYAELINTV
ncbi:MAG: NHLP family bacteriocin export ABC transporter peptidase/permease/ATPase subunit [Deltaproteobacteria bacterium]|nr:NHLP family bacteriocin export ABC transporter peptidase/permease/ATPase subunit [Deltaproteobacteria bacterium]